MSQRRLDSFGWILVVVSAVCWAAALGTVIDGLGSIGLLVGMAGATDVVLLTLRQTGRRLDRTFTHGYHAGYHAALPSQCAYPQECDVLDLAAERARRFR